MHTPGRAAIPLDQERLNTTQVALAIAVLAMSLAGPAPARASASDGVKPGTGGVGSGRLGGSGGDGGGQGGAAGGGGSKIAASNGNGGNGSSYSGTVATGGAVGQTVNADLTFTASRQGGSGMSGTTARKAAGNPFHGTSGAGGGAGAFVSGARAITVDAGISLSGGNGGDGDAGRPGCTGCGKGGAGGGGDGLIMPAGGLLTNLGQIQGGNGGAGATGAASSGSSGGGGGGHGVEGANLAVINAGVIRAGSGAAGGSGAGAGQQGAAIHWTGGTNALLVKSGSVIDGVLWVGIGATATISADVAGVSLNNWLLLDGAATIDTATQPLTYSGPITGGGSLTKKSAGVLVLSGGNTFDGGLTISAGEVQAQVGSLGTGAIRNDGTLRIAAPANATLSQALTGSGTLIKDGAAQLTLNGNAALSGTFQINGGTLSVGPAGKLTAGAVQLDGTGTVLDLSDSAQTATISRLGGVATSSIRTGAGALLVGDATDQRFDGTLSGAGSLNKQGDGSLILGGANTYSGGTTISAGTLVGSASSFGSGAIRNAASLVLDQATDAALDNTISGSGSVTKQGAGSLTLRGVNSYAGGTTISAGTLIGSASSFGSGAIRNDASLVLDQAADATLDNDISGGGTVMKQGGGTLALSGANTYSGGTTISAGTLVGSADSFGTGAIRNDAMLVLDQADDATLTNAISGSGAITKQGAGMLTLGNVNTHAGGTTIAAGTLVGSADSFGSGDIVDDGVLRIHQTTDADLRNAVGGSGSIEKTGAGRLTLRQGFSNTGGLSVLDGRIVADDQQRLGSGSVNVNGTGQIALGLSADTQLRHIGGDGLVAVDLGDTQRLLTTSAAPAGALAFTGILDLANASLALAGPGSESLSGAMLRLNSGARLLAEANTGSIGGLRMNGGSLRFTPAVADDASTLRPLLINQSLDLSGSGTVQVDLDLHGAKAADSMGSLMTRDDGFSVQLARTAPGGQVIGDAAGLGLTGGDGLAAGDTTDGEVVQGGQRVATTVTRYRLSTGSGQDGLYLTGRLLGIDVLANQQLMLSAPGAAIGAARDLSARIGGAGGLIVDAGDGGTISLSNPGNGYAGGTRIQTGTLALAGGSLPDGGAVSFESAGTGLDLVTAGRPQRLGGLDGPFASSSLQLGSGTLTLDVTGDHAFAGIISGGGGLTKTGAGTQTLSGLNTYGGGTSIDGGTLVGSAASFGTGAIRNDATLILDQSVDGQLNNNLSGGGSLVKRGDGSLTLGGTNAGTGPLRIEAGTLRATVDQLGSGAVVNQATLALDVPRDALLDSRLAGTGRLVKSGVGDLTLEGTSSVGGIDVRSGGLIVGAAATGGALLRGHVDLAAGARLQGSGTIDGNLHLSREATLQLRSASAALHVTGDLQLDAGSRTTVSIDPTSRQPVLVVDGRAAIDGVLLHVDAAQGDWSPGTRVDLVRAGQVDGRIAGVDTNLAFLRPTIESYAQGLRLVMQRNSTSFVDLAKTPNQTAVAGSLGGAEASAPAANLLVQLPREAVAPALEALSGGLQASAVNAPALGAAQQRSALGRRMRDVLVPRGQFDDQQRLWVTAYQSRSRLVADQVRASRGSSEGLLAGIDLLSSRDSRVGVAVDTDRQTIGSDDRDIAAARSGSVALYGATKWHGFNLRGALSYAESRIRTAREVVAGKSVSSLRAIERARHVEGFVELGLPGRLPFGQIEPFVQWGRAVTTTGGFKESGDEATALSGAATRDARSIGMAGLHGSTDRLDAFGATWSLQGTVALQYLGGPDTVARRVSLPGADSFVTRAASGAGTGAMVDLGLTVTPRPRLTLSFHVDHREAGASRENGARVQADWLF